MQVSENAPIASSSGWYDKTCVPFAREVAAQLEANGQTGPKYTLLLNLSRAVETFFEARCDDRYSIGLMEMMRDGNLADRGNNTVYNHKTQVLTKTLLLDRLAKTLGCSRGEVFGTVRSPWVNTGTVRLDRVVDNAPRGMKGFSDLKKGLKKEKQIREGMPQHDVLPVPENTAQATHLRGLTLLLRARNNNSKSKYLTIETNVLLVGFMLHWHSEHNTPLPQNGSDFFDQLERDGQQLGIPNLGAGMDNADKRDLFADMKGCQDVAIYVSPLALLHAVPAQLSLDRYLLIEWASALGPKPDYILRAEMKMWEVIMDVALGRDIQTSLEWLVGECQDDFNGLEANDTAMKAFFLNAETSDAVMGDDTTSPTPQPQSPSCGGGSALTEEAQSGGAVDNPSNQEADTQRPTGAYREPYMVEHWGVPDQRQTSRPPSEHRDVGSDPTEDPAADVDMELPREPAPAPDDAETAAPPPVGDSASQLAGGASGPPEGDGVKPAEDVDMEDQAAPAPATDPPPSGPTSEDETGPAEPPSPGATGAPDLGEAGAGAPPVEDVIMAPQGSEQGPGGEPVSATSEDETGPAEPPSPGATGAPDLGESELSDLELTSSDEEPEPAKPEPKTSGRVIKPPKIFESGATLTQPGPSKKRKLEPGTSSAAAGVSKVESFWDMERSYLKNAFIDLTETAAPAATKQKKGKKKGPAEPTPLYKESVNIPLFEEGKDGPPKDFVFRPDKISGQFDVPLVKKLVNMVISDFNKETGQPPHRQPSALDPSVIGSSSIFSVNQKHFQQMSATEKHAIFRHRHILVTDVDDSECRVEFDADGLQMLADIDHQPVEIQYANRKTAYNSEGMLVKGKLRDLLNPQDPNVAQNVLDLPLGHTSVHFPTSFQQMSTTAYSFNLVLHLLTIQDVLNVLCWGTGSTLGAVSWPHTDDMGFATVVWVQAGAKWWVLLRRKNEDRLSDEMGNVNTLGNKKWDVHDIVEDEWEAEAVHLKSNSILYMRPCTPHFVLGTESSIVLGRHFYSTSSIRRSCFGLVHTSVMGVGITNTTHDEGTRSLFRQLMALWYRHLVLQGLFDTPNAHIPDLSTEDGLLDTVALGCVLELATPLSQDRYATDYDPTNDENWFEFNEEARARTWFRVIMKKFAIKYATIIDGCVVHPSYIWQYCLVGFAAAFLTHINAKDEEVKPVPGRTPEKVTEALRWHFQREHPHLVGAFDAAIQGPEPRTSLTWNGPKIQIIRKSTALDQMFRATGIMEALDLPGFPLYPEGVSSANEVVNDYYRGVWPEDDL